MTGIVDDILGCTDEILSIRDDIGAIKHEIFILTRVWDGTERGDGTAIDTVEQMLPTPYLVDLAHSLRLREGGSIKQGDLLLKTISRQSYPNESDIDCSVDSKLEEKYYYIDKRLYEVISVTRSYVTWSVQIRKTDKTKTYIAS